MHFEAAFLMRIQMYKEPNDITKPCIRGGIRKCLQSRLRNLEKNRKKNPVSFSMKVTTFLMLSGWIINKRALEAEVILTRRPDIVHESSTRFINLDPLVQEQPQMEAVNISVSMVSIYLFIL